MPSRIIYLLTVCVYVLAAGYVFAAANPQLKSSSTQSLKPVAVIYFDDNSDVAKEHSLMVKNMIKEASENFRMDIRDYPLANEDEITGQVEKIADDGLGMIIVVEPQKIEALSKIPSLYPDIKFTVIGVNSPLYFANVRSILFKDQEGAYLMGVLAAMHSKVGTVGFAAKDDDEVTRNIAYAFLQGAKKGNPDIQVTEQLGNEVNQSAAQLSASKAPPITESKADVIFVYDEDLIDQIIRNAAVKKRLIITYNHDMTNTYPGLVLTSLLKHYDLAIYHTLRGYSRGEWRPGTQSMGIGDGFLDYVINNSNKSLMPKETMEQLEVNKDFISQGIIQINSLAQ